MALHSRCCVGVTDGDRLRGPFKAFWSEAGVNRAAGWIAGEPVAGHSRCVVGGSRASTQRTGYATTPVAGAGTASRLAARRSRHHERQRPPLRPEVPGLGVESQIYPRDRHDSWLDYLVTDSLGKRISPGKASVLALERTYWKP